jgi:hypothetical protein
VNPYLCQSPQEVVNTHAQEVSKGDGGDGHFAKLRKVACLSSGFRTILRSCSPWKSAKHVLSVIQLAAFR